MMNPSAPVLYDLSKIHKSDISIRPVVSYIKAPSYKICKTINLKLSQILNFQLKYIPSIKNSVDFVKKINNVFIPANVHVASFDICSLFTSIPVIELKTVLASPLNNSL